MNLSYKIRKDLSESDKHKEILSLEVSCKNSSNILLSCCYKPGKCENDVLSIFLKQVFKKSTAEKKPYYLIGDLNIYCLEYFENEKDTNFFNSLFECGAIVTSVARKSPTIIDTVITTNIFNETLKKA